MPELLGRRRAAILVALTAILAVALIGPAAASAAPPAGLKAFKAALGQVESGGNYRARNPVSGAYGKYQIMPSNWPAWAGTYLGDRSAKQSPENQEKVASGKLTSLYRSLDSWKRVAYWWLTGSKATTGWSTYARNYVARVMRLYKAGGGTAVAPAGDRYGERSRHVGYTGTWKTASHRGYTGDRVRYATKAGATATFSFTGRRVTWYGPTGPTRGKAKVYIDGEYVKTVDLRTRRFDARDALFRKTWSASGSHTLTIEVLGTKGRPMVAIDEFIVVP